MVQGRRPPCSASLDRSLIAFTSRRAHTSKMPISFACQHYANTISFPNITQSHRLHNAISPIRSTLNLPLPPIPPLPHNPSITSCSRSRPYHCPSNLNKPIHLAASHPKQCIKHQQMQQHHIARKQVPSRPRAQYRSRQGIHHSLREAHPLIGSGRLPTTERREGGQMGEV